MNNDDDAAARKERADAIRRMRDLRNAGITGPSEGEPDVPGPEASPGDEPNYVDLIDRKMRHEDG